MMRIGKIMFKDVLRVEVELFGFCNRKCVWCPPNREFDRTSNDAVLNKAVFRNMLIDLQNNGFATPVRETGFVRMTNSIISFNGYCEPMSNPKLINEYASVVKEVFGSDVDIYFNSNGGTILTKQTSNVFLKWTVLKLWTMTIKVSCTGEINWNQLGGLPLSSVDMTKLQPFTILLTIYRFILIGKTNNLKIGGWIL